MEGYYHWNVFLKSMPTTELANTDTAYNTINYLSLHLIDRNFFSPIYIVVRAVRNCVLSENWREYKSDKKQKLWWNWWWFICRWSLAYWSIARKMIFFGAKLKWRKQFNWSVQIYFYKNTTRLYFWLYQKVYFVNLL